MKIPPLLWTAIHISSVKMIFYCWLKAGNGQLLARSEIVTRSEQCGIEEVCHALLFRMIVLRSPLHSSPMSWHAKTRLFSSWYLSAPQTIQSQLVEIYLSEIISPGLSSETLRHCLGSGLSDAEDLAVKFKEHNAPCLQRTLTDFQVCSLSPLSIPSQHKPVRTLLDLTLSTETGPSSSKCWRDNIPALVTT